MAANMAPTTTAAATATTSVNAITSSTSTSTSSTFNTYSENNSCAVAADATNDVYNNFHELCRSCGKTNEELYDLFQTTIGWNTTASSASTAMTASPFNTSSTTCYTHLNTSTSNMPQPSSSSSLSPSLSSKATTFDSVAATAKATAKGQSNMENILQEMQIWHLQIKCNDGLPQRICAKCTAQFYMIHKFRRKCLKVQTQLRGLYEEEKMLQQAAAQVNEERQQQQEQPTEKDTKITIVPTSTPATAPPATSEAELPTPPNSLTMDHDLINDNYGKTQALSQKSTSVNFERNTWNANDGATLLDNVVKTMAKTEANEPTPTVLAAAYGKQTPDEKAPQLLLNTEKPSTSTTLTLKNHKEQKCDNERKNLKKCRTKSTSSAKGKLCIDQEELLAAHIIYKSNCGDGKQDELIQSIDDMEDCQETSTTTATDCEQNSGEEDIFKLRHINDEKTKTKDKEKEEEEEETEEYTENCITEPGYKANLEGLFITKAALKAYTISQTKTPSAYDNSECSASTTSNASTTSSALSSQETPDVTQLVCANLKQTIPSEPATTLPTTIHKTAADSGIQQVLVATVNKIANDDNNNDHNTDHHHNDPQHSTGHTNFSSSNSTFSSPTFATKSMLVKTEVRLKRRKSFVKRAGRRKTKVANKKRGHRYKLNAKMQTLRRRALFTYRTTSSSSSASSATSSPQSSNKQKSQHELKRLQDNRTCSSTSVKQHQKQLKVVEQYRLKNNIATKSTYEIETKIEQKININNRNLKEKAEKLETPAIIMEDESSSTSTILPATTASSSFMKIAASSATTPAVTDLVKPLKEKHEINSYATNANAIKRRRQQSPLSKSSRGGNITTTTAATASATSTTLWKTKAAMKANANDMHMDMDVKQQQKDNEHLTNDIKETVLLPHKAAATTTCNIKDSATPTTLCLNLATSLKTHNENPSNCNTMEKNLGNNSETVLSSKDHKVKDIKSTIQQQQQQKHLNNLRPEEADQKQIKPNINKDKGKSEQTGETENVLNSQQETTEAKEFINHNNPLQQKPIYTSSTATTTDSTALTPSAKNGCMKLIIQRKRGARFKCRRKDDETQQDILPKKRKLNSKKLETKVEMESLFSLDLNGDYSKEDKELIEDSLRHMEEITNDSDILENIKEQMGINEKSNKENYEEKSIKKKYPAQEKRNFDMMSKIKTNRLEQNSDGYETENSIINLTQDECKEDLEDPLELDCLDYRDQNSCVNERNEEDDEDEEEDITNNYELNDNIPQQFKLSKENLKLENVDYADRPKKLIIRVPLASLTQDFKRLHLSMQQEGNNKENSPAKQEELKNSNIQELENSNLVASSAPPSFYKELNTLPLSGSSQSDLLGFSQSSVSSENSLASSSQKSMEQIRLSNHGLCAASSKINDFINDFQNNCIDSSEIDDVNNEILPILPNASKELSDEIRDVEDTLNGILSEMHDKDMYTPRSVDQEDLFPHSVYSPLTDAPTTPSQSFYAESPCTMNGNPMSVSPFIHQGMDYNAMTPQSNHSSMGPNSHMSSSCGGNSNNPNVYSGHFSTYNECYEETTQSELIAFQNDIPCFENIELTNPPSPSELIATTDLSEVINEESPIIPLKASNNTASQVALNKNDITTNDQQIVDYVDLCQDYTESNETKEIPLIRVPVNTPNPELVANLPAYNTNNYQAGLPDNNPIQTDNSLLTSTPNSHYIVTNTAQGPVLIANPHVNTGHEQIDAAFKAHNNLQFVTLGQALEANKTQHPTAAHLLNNSTPDINWPSQSNAPQQQQFTQQQPVIPTANPTTTTYFINAGGEVYRASVPTPSLQNSNVNSLIVPPPAAQQQQSQTHNVAFSKSSIDANENYLQTLQQHTQQQQHPNRQQQQQYPIPQLSPQTSQYIMVVNNLGTTPQYYATQANQTTAMASPTVLFQPASVQNSLPTLNNQCNFINNSNLTPSVTPEISRPTPTNTPTITPPILASPKTPSVSPSPSQQTMHQRVNQQLQQQIKQRQLQLLQPRSPNCTQKINLICRFCHKRPKFTNNVDYSNHIINMHPAEKPYNCPHCSMHFTRRFERQHHVAQVHGSRYQCAQCGLSFCAQRTLDFHLQKYHANLGRSYQQQQQAATSSSSSPVNQQQNSSSSSATATYQLLQHNQQQRLVRVEDVHVQVTGESKNKRSIDLQLDDADINASQSNNEVENLSATTQQQTRKLCCPDCNGDNDDCCASKKHQDHNNHQPISQQQEQQQEYTGNESVKHHHITIPSPEQTEPDSTTTLRHFRKRQLSEMSPFSLSSSTSSSFNNSNDNVVVCGDGSSGGGEQIVVERTLRGSHNCLFCEESFTNEIALRKHHHLAHGTQATMPFVCTVCKRGFRMRTALQRHMETHDAEGRPYECNICQVRFPRPSQLTLHKLTVHKFEKPHSCEECGKQFGTESAMKAHAKVHEDATATTTTSTSQMPSSMYVDTATIKEENVNIQTTTSGEIATIDSSPLDTDNDVLNTSETNIVSELTT